MFWNNSHTFYNYLKCSAQLSPSLRNRNRLCRHTATSTHFSSSRKHDIAHGNNAQDCFAISGYSVRHKIQREVSTITRAILLQNQSSGVSNLQRGQSCEEIFDTLTTFLNPLVRMNLLYGKWTVGFFSLASKAGALRPHEALMLLLLYSKPIVRKKRLFCSLHVSERLKTKYPHQCCWKRAFSRAMFKIPSFGRRCDFESGHRALVQGQISRDRGFLSLSNTDIILLATKKFYLIRF